MNASFIRERQRYSTVVTAGPLSTHMILFAISMWKNIFSSAGRARTKNELPTAKNLSWQGSAYISSVCGEIPNTPKVSKLFMHLASGYSLTHHHPPPPTPRLPSRSQLKVPLSRRFNNSHLAPICAPSRLCQSLKAWHGVLFLGQHFSPIVCSDDSLMKPWPSCAPFEVTSERRAALIRKPWDANTLHSGIPVAALREGGVFALRRRISS